MLPSSQPTTTSPKVKATVKNVRERLKLLGRNFPEFDKCKAPQNRKDEKNIATTPVCITEYVRYDYLRWASCFNPHPPSHTLTIGPYLVAIMLNCCIILVK